MTQAKMCIQRVIMIQKMNKSTTAIVAWNMLKEKKGNFIDPENISNANVGKEKNTYVGRSS